MGAVSDTALGLLGTVFTLLYAVVGLPLGRLSDKAPRKWILAGGVFVWSLLTAFSGVARSFSQLVVARLGVGVGEATCSPASTSLIGDLYPDEQRARAMSVWMLGLPLGLGLSAGAGGWLAQNWGWRTRSSSPACRACCAPSPRSRSASPSAACSRNTRSAQATPRHTVPDSCCRFRRCGG